MSRIALGKSLGLYVALALLNCAFLLPVEANEPSAGNGVHVELHARIGYLGKQYPQVEPLSLVDKIYDDAGLQGARVGIIEDNMTGRLIGHDYKLVEAIVPESDDIVVKAKELLADGIKLIVADLEPADLIAVSDLPEASDALIFNVQSSDVALRHENCRRNVFHIPPDWAMRADALAQYLIWKKWKRWVLIAGERPKDVAFADALRRAAKRFGGKIIAERTYAYSGGSR
ncbi:MAG TPA: ABC transporter substrate-binding protein, partial [Hyphomicrobium sp.]|nr:ABC transporter substrate-binding protein [Hyphomicrobium sp.]